MIMLRIIMVAVIPIDVVATNLTVVFKGTYILWLL